MKNETILYHCIDFPESDTDWTEEQWKTLIDDLVEEGLVSYREVAAALLGNLNPPQVGTSIASNKSFQSHFPPRKTWTNVREWFYGEDGMCADCRTRLDLQADHIIPREELGAAADTLDNLTLRCRRCNVIKRPSHVHGGETFLTAEAALMWILLFKKPSTYDEYNDLCREYGLTMANIRFQEAWAMAHWLEKEGLYDIEDDSKY